MDGMPRSDLTRESPHELGKWALSPAVHLPLQAQTGGLTRGQNSGRPEKRLGQKHPTMAPSALFTGRIKSLQLPLSKQLPLLDECMWDSDSERPGHALHFILPQCEVFPG